MAERARSAAHAYSPPAVPGAAVPGAASASGADRLAVQPPIRSAAASAGTLICFMVVLDRVSGRLIGSHRDREQDAARLSGEFRPKFARPWQNGRNHPRTTGGS